ncbi:hypothetical protein CS006_09280 [Bifidobacterium primatium]|uniref:Gram-positive cocci surface proteins LPxTG domain-containing protein n=2 Tax=Bifidobacterium TaxID=1678 RepID=A0A2M9H7F0_9BIFI|nr:MULTISPECIES: SpaH/EbpB family LPXTG-anchored major pilin [Bifidobacterium]NEG95634.1 SpaH/EbpB family LPXTG-anchored major pilin [Bifidobacterium sp. SMB2]NEH11947.1 SpaH/EbpB family LPXTG-anchored major pilin [Bifidobacterium saimiriisciurei]PJM72741.1 hypothetical protein CS006_09280 [Bifidobacterium primatium]
MFHLKKGGLRAVAVAAAVATLGSLGLAAPAMAADATPNGAETNQGSITVKNVQGGATVTAYKVIDVNYKNLGTADNPSYVPTTPQYEWNAAVVQWVKDYDTENGVDYIGDNNAVTDQYAALPSDTSGAPKADGSYSSKIAKFYDKLSAAVGRGEVRLTSSKAVTVGGTADATTVTLDGLEVGGYLVKITNTSGNTEGVGTVADYSYRPVVVTIGFSQEGTGPWTIANAEIDSKRDKATIDKSVNEDTSGHKTGEGEKNTGSDTVGIGSVVTYNVRSDVPVFPKDAIEKNYVIADTMDKALTPNYTNSGSHKFKVYGVDSNGKETPLGEGASNEYYTLTTTDAKDLDGKAATWVLKFDYEKIRQYSKIHVEYTATVNEHAVVASPIKNSVKLQYTNNPYEQDSHRTVPDEVKVYTFGIKVHKVFIENGVEKTDNLPEGAEFAVYKDGASTPLQFVKTADGEYRLAKAGETGTVTSLPVKDGYLKVTGLDDGKYQLEETKAPAGYVKLEGKQDVTITPVKDDASGEYTGAVSAPTDEIGFVSTEVKNTKGMLPQTGSVGMVLMTVAGVLLIAGGVTVLRRRRA